MISTHERSDLIHIMKMNRLSVSDADTARVCFNGQIRGKKYEITILMVEDLASVIVKRDGVRVGKFQQSGEKSRRI